MWKQGMIPADIAVATGFDRELVEHDIRGRALASEKDELLSEGKANIFAAMWQRLEHLQNEAYSGWVRSQLVQRIVRIRKQRDDEGRKTWEKVTEERSTPGDPRFINSASDCLWRQAQLAGFVADGGAGRGPVGAEHGDTVDESDTVAIVEVSSRAEAAAVQGKRYCRISGPEQGAVIDAVSVSAAVEVVEGAASGPSAGAADLGGADGGEAAVE